MSTHPLDRRRVKPFGRRFEPRHFAISCLAILLVFAAAFGIGHMNRSDGSVAERTPPPLPGVATPVPAALASAPTIKLAVVRPPPAPKPSAPATRAQPAASTPTVTPATPTPSVAPTVTQPASETPASKPAAPVTPSAPQHSSGGSGSGSGTSFESSG